MLNLMFESRIQLRSTELIKTQMYDHKGVFGEIPNTTWFCSELFIRDDINLSIHAASLLGNEIYCFMGHIL